MSPQKRRRARRSVSLGTVVMLTVTALVLVGFFALLPSFTGHQDIRIDAAKLAVAMDTSISQIAAVSGDLLNRAPQPTALPPGSLATSVPHAAPTLAPMPSSAPPAVTPVPRLSFSLCAAGSIELNSSMRKNLTIDDEYRLDILTDQVQEAMDADLSIATLSHTIVSSEKLSNLNMPAELLSSIHAMGVNVLSLGHADILNSGMNGLAETAQAVQQAGMRPHGIYASAQQREENRMMQINGLTVALLHYQEKISSTGREKTSETERNDAYSPLEMEGITSDIQKARQSGAQVVAVTLGWGKEGANEPTAAQQEMAQAMADAGADIILGTGSNVLQPVHVLSADRGDGRYHPVLCAYSLGSLFHHDRDSRTTLSSILLQTDVVYDASTGCVAFENLCYTPTYAWRGKEDGRTLVRTLLNDGSFYPSFISSDQKGVMERCYKLVTDVMADTGIPQK